MRSLTGKTSLSLSDWISTGLQKRNRSTVDRGGRSVGHGMSPHMGEDDEAADADYEVILS